MPALTSYSKDQIIELFVLESKAHAETERKLTEERLRQTSMVRHGEPVFAVLLRNRSGQYASEIDYRIDLHEVEKLPQGEKQELMETALALVENLRQYCTTPAHAAKGE